MQRISWALCALIAATTVRADMILSADAPRVVQGGDLDLKLTITNERPQSMVIDLPAILHVRFDTGTAITILDVTPDRSGEIVVPPSQFAVVHLRGTLPSEARGMATLSPTGLATNTIALQIAEPSTRSQSMIGSRDSSQAPPRKIDDATLVDKPPPLAVSVYEPVYFLMGGDGGWNAKFQISFRYQMFDGKGPLANRLTWIDDLYLAFSQTSLWDLNELSKPFKDSSYKPRVFYSNYDLMRVLDGRLRLGFEAGFGHESNGKDGDASRSYNMFYARPALSYGDPEGFNFYLAPLIHNYIGEDENPDIEDYRGYVDWLIGAGSKGGLNFWATIRKGERSTYGSTELNLSFPLSKISGGDLTGWLMLQYFGGYGESLLDYNKKLDSQLRLGIAIAL